MGRQIAFYRNCTRTNEPHAGMCKLERFKERGEPLRFGKVLQKCSTHADVPDDELPAVLTRENLAVKEAARSEGPDEIVSSRFEGRGAARRLVVTRLPKRTDA